MKKLLGIMIVLGLALGASAQTKIRGQVPQVNRGGNGGGKQVVVVAPRAVYSPFYNPYGFRNWGYGPYAFNPYMGYGFGQARVSAPSGLELEIERIKSDFGYELSTVRRDKSISKAERKQQIRELKHAREQAIIDAKADYYKSRDRRY